MTKTAIISGGAGGLGKAFGAKLRDHGWFVVALDLPGPELHQLRDLPRTCAIGCDITDGVQLAETAVSLREARPSIDMVVYNAGITHIGPFAEQLTEDHRRVFEVNYFAAVAMAGLFGPDIRRSRGTHLAISSVAGFSPLAYRTAYAASKHALEGFFSSLRSEERPHGVSCLIAAPSFIATNPGTPSSGLARPGAAKDAIDSVTPGQAAEELYRGLAAKRDFIPIGRVARASNLLNRLSPALFQRLMERRILKTSAIRSEPLQDPNPH
ncbi:SDR family NAD(P)-dependent oxidoreductase [Roseibium denhamense]|uniref:Short-chain dehydrogenase n=1 Tax=Roseibium denhamense TaxID=76305 RepID=A0ABY1NNT4_9HYPH|nr:SDR family NAD(P)-dependent oxidoreductase [Roseibium denhamense]SMP14437.1 Short-chain dehydrogenase [Roseibium denhamense]